MSHNKFYLTKYGVLQIHCLCWFLTVGVFFSLFWNNLHEKLFLFFASLKGFYCSLRWVSLLVQGCRLQLEFFYNFQSHLETANIFSFKRIFLQKSIGMENLTKNPLLFCKMKFSLCPLLKIFSHNSQKFRIFSHCSRWIQF